jgi:hypothetical protein
VENEGIGARAECHPVAAVATARKSDCPDLAHLLTKEQDYLWPRPSLVAAKRRQLLPTAVPASFGTATIQRGNFPLPADPSIAHS